MIYLASPYSANPEHNYQLALSATAHMVAAGYIVYSPIVHCHPLHQAANLPQDFAFWRRHNFGILRKASELWVLDIQGWQESIGVQAEINFAKQCYMPISVVNLTGSFRRNLPSTFLVD